MKLTALQTTCALALSMMSAAVATHWVSVQQTVSLAGDFPVTPAPIAVIAPSAELPEVQEARRILAEAKIAAAVTTPVSAAVAPEESALNARIERLVTAFEGVVAQNAELRNQVAETNRDLMALQFQVDSHSESFRPLKVAEDPTPMQGGPGVLPPKIAP